MLTLKFTRSYLFLEQVWYWNSFYCLLAFKFLFKRKPMYLIHIHKSA